MKIGTAPCDGPHENPLEVKKWDLKMKREQDAGEVYPAALTIAGSDSGGGAGIQADLRTFSAFGVYGTSAVTAITAQNPCEVRRIIPVPADGLEAQLRAVFAKFAVRAVKTGMLHDASLIRVCAATLGGMKLPVVADPVMVSSSGALLLEEEAVDAMKDELLPLCDWMTPNVAEACRLLDVKIGNFDDMVNAAMECSGRWGTCCVIKGGDMRQGDNAIDVVASRGSAYMLSTPRVEEPAGNAAPLSHGTGCTFSAAIAAGIAVGMGWRDTLISAKGFVYGSLVEAVEVGKDIHAMYPPARAYRNAVEFKKL